MFTIWSSRGAPTAFITDAPRRRVCSGGSWNFLAGSGSKLTPQRDIADIYTGEKGYEITYKGPRAVEKKDLDDYLRQRRFSLETIFAPG